MQPRNLNKMKFWQWMLTNIGIYNTTFKKSLAYRFSMVLSVVTGPIIVLTQYIIWSAVFKASQKATLAGYTFQTIVMYYAITTLTFYLVWDQMEENVSRGVQNGSLIQYLVSPLSYIRYEFLNKLGHRSLAALVEFSPVVIILGFMFGWGIYPIANLWAYVLLVIIAFILTFQLHALVGMLAFWFIRPRGLIWTYRTFSMLVSGLIIPLTFFPKSVQAAFQYLPFQYLSFVPAQAFIGGYSTAGSHALTNIIIFGFIQIVILWLVMIGVWKVSVKKFCVAGA
jgi:ABC-2 type transport system permease protein